MSPVDPRAAVHDPAGPAETAACPGCGAVLAVVPGLPLRHPGASAGCAALFAVTVRGLRDESAQDPRAAALLQLATAAYDAQHLVPGEQAGAPVRLRLVLEHGRLPAPGEVTDAPAGITPPAHWTTTIADLAADLDVVDLPTLVRSWATAVRADWSPSLDRLRTVAGGTPPPG
ncbi:DUF5946 family protein [Modestobacter roseus]|uniref:Uncharacterized protein n=1 Tax=Modestobacter roseus TaxID=1181884 RepID=A0A562IXL7_9ACTN|nr:DUF5946 family protein [Modestobacter roseus]MQA33396.1 hypothetical protein [Modestobacter roseus]TWH75314.1 hypothetical protein JD78_03870 [Modestobacter roseus]